jgi:hypothetical protein
MATNTGKGYREGAVKNRSQLKTLGGWTERDRNTGRFLRGKPGEPYKGVRKEPGSK